MKKIAVDAMGGDNAPQALVEGTNRAVQEFSDIEILLYGGKRKKASMSGYGTDGSKEEGRADQGHSSEERG